MMLHPYMSAAIADERRNTMLAEAAAARMAKQARSQRLEQRGTAGHTSLIRRLKLVAVGRV